MCVNVIPDLFVKFSYFHPLSGGLQSAFYIRMLCPFMITYFFGMKIWGLSILTQEGTLHGLVPIF
jgi:hypothetical protein